MDIVLKEPNNYYGGILIRGIQELDTDNKPIPSAIVDGPWNTASIILSKQIVDKNRSFYFKKIDSKINRNFKKSPRVGLFLKKVEDLEYICKPWRYNTTPLTTKKAKHLLFLQLDIAQDADKDMVVSNKKLQESYKSYFDAGTKMDPKQFEGIKMTVENSCKLFGCYSNKKTS